MSMDKTSFYMAIVHENVQTIPFDLEVPLLMLGVGQLEGTSNYKLCVK